jgi:hypothetical protein
MAQGAAGGWERGAGVASLVAALVHGGLAPEHFAEWWGYGAFFVVAGAAQAVLGLALALDAFGDDLRARRTLWLAGAVGNALLVLLYLASRTVGVPFAGPEAGEVEPWDVLGVATTAAEALLVGVLAWLLLGEGGPTAQPDASS